MLPNFIIIGSPRCGTTWVHDNLRRHPDIFLPKAKELHYFDNKFDKSIEYYESLFADWSGQKAVGEITPSYLSGAFSRNGQIPEMIHRYLPAARLIAVLRDPVDRAYSHYWYNVSEDARNVGVSFEQKLSQRPEILREGFYAEHLARYLSLFDKQQMLILLYDDLREDPAGFLRRIYEFLEVDPTFSSGVEKVNRNSAEGRGNLAHLRVLWQAERALAKVGWYGLAEKVRRLNGSGATPPMNADTRRKLVETYRASNEWVAALLGRDLSRWNQA